ncbi:Serine/threonine protein phosphatase [Phaffia rhodozyma]|uniref:Protein phosphatase n=1 Tax=Phaffia rhodozyma TaxID=264483 RepID=A0A0F7SS08_PHARH|nr:Serine/threonine protein phosphatase [Phaffia rhodozyma]
MSLAQNPSSKKLINVSSRSLVQLQRHAARSTRTSPRRPLSTHSRGGLQVVYQSNATVNHAAGQAGPQPSLTHCHPSTAPSPPPSSSPLPSSLPGPSSNSPPSLSFFEFSTFSSTGNPVTSPPSSNSTSASSPSHAGNKHPRSSPPSSGSPSSLLSSFDPTSTYPANASPAYSPSALEIWSLVENPGSIGLGSSSDVSAGLRRRRLVFDAGAFGIPKTTTGGLTRDIHKASTPFSIGPGLPDGSHPHGHSYTGSSSSAGWNSEGESESVRVGEDAYFVKTSAGPVVGGVQALGIADGVGGWSRKGIKGANPGRFSALLMSHIASLLPPSSTLQTILSQSAPDPVGIMQAGYERTLEQAAREGFVGSSTALLAVLKGEELRVANVGDCSLWVIREGRMVFRTEEMQHAFNYPFQLGTNSKETPIKDAKSYTVKVAKDDVVLLCTDGLVDNLYDEEILEEIASFSPPSVSSSSTPSSSSLSSTSTSAHSSTPSSPASSSTTGTGNGASDNTGSPSSSPSTPSSPSPSSLPHQPNQRPPISPQRISEALCSRAKAMSASRGTPYGPKQETSSFVGEGGTGGLGNERFEIPSPGLDVGVDGAGIGNGTWRGRDINSPFGVKASVCGLKFWGGKEDDISVLVAIIGDPTVSPPHA